MPAHEQLQNLQKIGKLKAEPPDQVEFDGLVRSATRKLPDAENQALSPDSRFILAYDAAHSLALAARRWHGFRSQARYFVFQVFGPTVSLPTAKWRAANQGIDRGDQRTRGGGRGFGTGRLLTWRSVPRTSLADQRRSVREG